MSSGACPRDLPRRAKATTRVLWLSQASKNKRRKRATPPPRVAAAPGGKQGQRQQKTPREEASLTEISRQQSKCMSDAIEARVRACGYSAMTVLLMCA